jgi:transcriptional regulator with XRE-family HTH domain
MPPTPAAERSRALQLGAELREARRRAGLTLKDVAASLRHDHSTLSRWENGTHKPDAEDVSAVLAILGVTGEERSRILDLSRHDGLNDWVAPGVERQLASLIQYERVAELITAVNPLLVPGLLQTRDYALSLLLGAGVPRGEAEQSALVRTGRQEVLTRRRPVNYIAVIGEHALRYPPCEASVMADQLHHLALMAERPNVHIHVLPLGIRRYTAALQGSYVLLEVGRDKPVVQLDGFYATSTITDVQAVESYRTASEKICNIALNTMDSLQLIASLAKGEQSE